ncbi:MAG: hypothetical protein LIO96_03205 [Lachnospiraceae bacterium]|nr:hypothetical protein [Lachnospiraceae bacterium]
MKRKPAMVCVALVILSAAAGCSAAQNSAAPAGSNQEDLEFSSEETDEEDAVDAFAAEDILNFVFEGEEYTIPFPYEQLQASGWTVAPDMDEIYGEGEDRVLLFMEHPDYEEILMTVSSKTMSAGIKDTESLVCELEENGVWGLGVSLESMDLLSDTSLYPEFVIRGVGFGSSAADVLAAFGDGYSSSFSSPEDGIYVYDVQEKMGEDMVDYHLEICLEDDQVASLDILVYYY